MEIDNDPAEALGDDGTMKEEEDASKSKLDFYDEVNDESYLQKLLASNPPTFAEALRDVESVLLRFDAAHNSDLSSTSAEDNPVQNSDRLEIALRSHGVRLLKRVLLLLADDGNAEEESTKKSARDENNLLQRSRFPLPLSPALVELGDFWTASVQLCRHLARFASIRHYDKHLHMPTVRKLPFVLLEDILDGLTLRDAKAFWVEYFVPIHPYLLKMDEGVPAASNLVLLKTLNAFWKRCAAASDNNDDGGEWAATVLQTLASSFPLGERSATRVWGSRNLDTLSDFDTNDQYQQHVTASTAAAAAAALPSTSTSGPDSSTTITSASEPTTRIDYSVYQSFWSLQQDFSSPYIKNVGVFLSRVKTVLEAMETTTPQLPAHHEVAGSGATTMEAAAAASSSGKYLTHARLLPYQLQDAEFRATVLTQLLIVAQHVKNEAPGVGTQLEDSRQRAVKLLSLTHPELLSSLQYVLRISEPQWSAWKKNKFPDIDVKPQKQPRERPLSPPTNKGVKKRRLDAAAPLLDVQTDLPSICAPLQAPTLEEHLVSHEYIDALDPEAGIEDEYHPKSNPYFCWQALRLLPVSDLDKVHFRTGDFETAVRHIWKRDKGIEIPVAGHDAAMDEGPAESADEPASGIQEEALDESLDMLVEEEPNVGEVTQKMEDEDEDENVDDSVEANDSRVTPIDAPREVPAQEGQVNADSDAEEEKSEFPNSDARQENGASQRAEEPEPSPRNGGNSIKESHPNYVVGPRKMPLPLKRGDSDKLGENTDSTGGRAGNHSSDRASSRGPIAAPTRSVPGWSPPQRENSHSGKGRSNDAEGYRSDGPANRNRPNSFTDRPRQSGSQPDDAGRRGPKDEAQAEGRRGGINRGGEGGTESVRDERNGGQGARDGGGRSMPYAGRDDRGPHRGRDDRGPPPGRDDRGPPPRRDDRGPTPRRDERAGPQPGSGGCGPPQSKVGREDRGSHNMGRRDESRGPPPPPQSADGGRDERNGPTHGRRDDRWVRGDRLQDRREGGGGGGSGGGGGGGQHRGTSHDGPRPRR